MNNEAQSPHDDKHADDATNTDSPAALGEHDDASVDDAAPRTNPADEAARAEPQAPSPQTIIDQLTKERDDLRDQLLRLSAEMQNMQTRTMREREKMRKYAVEGLVEALLPVLDSLTIGASSGGDADALRQGMAMTSAMLSKVLQDNAVRTIEPQAGDAFDPAQHEAVSAQPTDAQLPDTIVTVVQTGYLLADRLVRPARVIVATAPPAAAKIDTDATETDAAS